MRHAQFQVLCERLIQSQVPEVTSGSIQVLGVRRAQYPVMFGDNSRGHFTSAIIYIFTGPQVPVAVTTKALFTPWHIS